MKRKEMEPERPSLFDLGRYSNTSQSPFNNFRTSVRFSSFSINNPDFQSCKKIRFSSEHGCLIMDYEASSSSTSTSFLCDLWKTLARGDAHIPEIYTRDLISTIGSRDHYSADLTLTIGLGDRYSADLVPNLGENSSSINGSKDWGFDLSL